jgi:cellulose synthase/poly-beta-1,6-N-acetylglucosamine synthase-like glycosyltransferase
MADLYHLFLYGSLFTSLFFEVFLLITYLEVREEIAREDEMTARGPKSFPSVTVIVPCYNEEKTVAATVKSILNLSYPKSKLSLILVDDGSKDGTWKSLKKFESHPQVKLLRKENGGKHTAMNLALESVTTDLVGALDADSFVTPEALRKIVPYFEDEKVMAVTPSIKIHEPKGVLQLIQKTEYSWSIFLRRMLSSLNALYVTPGPFSIFRTQVFRELGGYKAAHMTEDMEMAMRMQKNHYKIVNSHGAHVYTVAPKKLRALVKQRVRWTYGFLNNAFDYRAIFFKRQYGHFGMFIMPIATVSAVTSLAMVTKVLVNFASSAWEAFVRFQAVGFAGKFQLPSFDWYFINTGVLPIITITALSLTLLIIYFSLKLADGKFRLSRGLFYYLFLYAFLTPLWLTQSIFKTIFRRQISWR